MFEYYNNILCVQGGWLYNEGNILSINNYRNLVRRGFLNIMRRGCKGTPALIEYDSLPERFRNVIVKNDGNPHKTTKLNPFKDYLETDILAIEFYNNYTLDDGSALPQKNIKQYIAEAEILNAVKIVLENKTAKRRALGKGTGNIWANISEIIQELPRHKYPHSLPVHPRRLQGSKKGNSRSYSRYMLHSYEGLIHKGFCNKNSEKINDDAKHWVLSRWADRVYKVANTKQLFNEYNEKAESKGWKQLKDEKAIYNYLHQEEIKSLWYGHRYGELKAKEKFIYQFSTELPSMRDSLWYSDGTKLNFYYLDDNGKVATRQVYEVMDVYSEVFLGYHISKTEDYEAQYNAYKMAIKTAGHRPYQIGVDNQGGHKKLDSGDFFTKITRMAIKTQPYNGKSKTIENAFGRFQMQYLKKYWFFTGQNVTATAKESKANMEFILANTKNLPTLKEVIKIYEQCREEWNNATHYNTGEPKNEMYRTSENPKSPEVSLWDMVDMFWLLRAKPVTCSAYGISFKEKKVEYTYMVHDENRMPDMDWLRKNVDKKFHIKFDPENMDVVYLYEKDALGLRFVTAAETKIKVHRGKQEQEDWEASYIQEVIENQKATRLAMVNDTDAILEAHGVLPEDYGLNTPKVSGIKSTYKKNKGKKAKKSDIGQHTKEVSNEENEEINIYNMM